MAAALVETCQSLPKRPPRGRLGSLVDVRNRLHRMRRRFNHFWSISLSSPQSNSNFRPLFAFRALGEH